MRNIFILLFIMIIIKKLFLIPFNFLVILFYIIITVFKKIIHFIKFILHRMTVFIFNKRIIKTSKYSSYIHSENGKQSLIGSTIINDKVDLIHLISLRIKYIKVDFNMLPQHVMEYTHTRIVNEKSKFIKQVNNLYNFCYKSTKNIYPVLPEVGCVYTYLFLLDPILCDELAKDHISDISTLLYLFKRGYMIYLVDDQVVYFKLVKDQLSINDFNTLPNNNNVFIPII